MICKKCGFNMNEKETKCPFCGHEVKDNDTSFNVYSKVEKSEVKQVKPEPYKKIEKKEINNFRNQNGYIDIKIPSILFLVIGVLSYGIMEVLSVIFYSLFIGIKKAQGIDFGCLTDGSSCSEQVMLAYETCSSLAQIITELLIVTIVAIIFRKKLKLFFKEAKDKNTYKWYGICFGLMYGLTFVYNLVLQYFNVTSSSTNQEAVNQLILAKPLIGFIFVVIAAPVFEEIVFRFGIYRTFVNGNKKKEIVGLIITTLAFALLHMVATITEAFADPTNPDVALLVNDLWFLPSYLIGAFALTFAYYKSKNLFTTIILHMTWNALSFVAIFASDLLPKVEEVLKIFG